MKIVVLLTLFLIVELAFCFGQLSNYSNAQQDDSNARQSAVQINLMDTVDLVSDVSIKNYQELLNELLKKNKNIILYQKPVFLSHNKRQTKGKEFSFYLISSITLLFGFFKVFYAGYFNNIFRVFFNTSLRQNQLTDMLMQSKLPSLIFNTFFSLMSGLYVWLLLNHFGLITQASNKVLIFCVLAIGLIYIVKFCVIKFLGWVTGMNDAAITYIFVIFLINKIIGFTLIPFIILIAFTSPAWIKSIVIFSFLAVGVLFLLRFFRTYDLLQDQLNITRLHFSLYIITIEILPLFIIYKMSLSILDL